MMVKSPVVPGRIRKIPKSFSWVDHRLVRDRYIDGCTHTEAAMYLFLVCVSDSQGLSYYGDRSLMSKLSMDRTALQSARTGLIRKGLIAWLDPLYQVLSLEPVHEVCRTGGMMKLGDILQAAKEANRD